MSWPNVIVSQRDLRRHWVDIVKPVLIHTLERITIKDEIIPVFIQHRQMRAPEQRYELVGGKS
jgi:hypothetical protein